MTKDEIESWLNIEYPLTIISDRYNGSYSEGKFLAFPLSFNKIDKAVNGNDIDCVCFWIDYQGFVGRGNTPNEAYENLIFNLKKKIY